MEHCLIEESEKVSPPHWHEQLLLMYIEKGEMGLQCGNKKILAEQGDIVIVNPNEIHSVDNPGMILEYYLLKINLLMLLGNQPDLKQALYTEPLLKSRILFENKVSNDQVMLDYMKNMIREYQEGKEGD